MKTTYLLTGILCLVSTLLFGQNKLSIDAKNSIINWTGHAEIGTYAPEGTLNFKNGTVSVNNGAIKSATLAIDMKSMQQDNEHLLSHLKSEDFFDVEKYPASTIKIYHIDNGIAYGQLTIKGKPLPFQCPVEIKKEAGHFTISGSTIIDRTKYGIIYNSGNFFSGLGDKAIRNTFEINFKLIVSSVSPNFIITD